MKIEKTICNICSSYLKGFKEIKNHKNSTNTKTTLAALKIFTYFASCFTLPALAYAIRYLCGRISKQPPMGSNQPIVITVPFPLLPLSPSPSPPTNKVANFTIMPNKLEKHIQACNLEAHIQNCNANNIKLKVCMEPGVYAQDVFIMTNPQLVNDKIYLYGEAAGVIQTFPVEDIISVEVFC